MPEEGVRGELTHSARGVGHGVSSNSSRRASRRARHGSQTRPDDHSSSTRPASTKTSRPRVVVKASRRRGAYVESKLVRHRREVSSRLLDGVKIDATVCRRPSLLRRGAARWRGAGRGATGRGTRRRRAPGSRACRGRCRRGSRLHAIDASESSVVAARGDGVRYVPRAIHESGGLLKEKSPSGRRKAPTTSSPHSSQRRSAGARP